MTDQLVPSRPDSGAAARAAPAGSLATRMAAVATLAAAATAGGACLIAWQRASGGASAYAPENPQWEPALWAVLGLLSRQGAPDGRGVGENPSLRMSAAEVVMRCGRALPVDTRLEALGVSCSASPAARASVVLLVPQGATSIQGEALLELTLRQALAEIALSEEAASLWFWRDRAATAAERLSAERAAARRERGEHGRADRAQAAALKLGRRERWAGLGRLLAASGPFDAWIVAVSDNGAASVAAASSPKLAGALNVDQHSALGTAMRRRSTIVRGAGRRRGSAFHEDKLFKDFAAYLCVPFESGAIALAASKPLLSAARERAEALAERLGPVAAGWAAAQRAERLGSLVRQLGGRLFRAVDTERARIARDLHDDQAQVLAAARLALEGDRDSARAVFERLEAELRARLRELRPATLGDRTLAAALRAELGQLAKAGIETRLAGVAVAKGLPAEVQQICYQAAREAISNIARHARATRVEMRIESDGPAARLIVIDNGRGIQQEDEATGGTGLSGLAERLEFVGGRMRIESRRGMTRLIAEIPL